MKSVLQLRDVLVKFPVGRRQSVTAVDRVSLEIHEGETLGLIGESGSGKSTVARAMMGLVPVRSGTVRFRGDDVAGFSRRQRRAFTASVQMVFQDPHSALDPRRTILQSVREPLDVLRLGERSERDEVARNALSEVGLADILTGRYPHQLSGGQKQRVNIARALVTEPRLLICDESVAALDVALQAEILNLLQGLKEQHDLTLVFISHDLGVVSHLADRVSVMYLGRVVEEARTDDLVTNPLHPYTEALLSAQPNIRGDKAGRIVLRGDLPSPLNPPSGCRFRTRCPHAVDACGVATPELAGIGPGRVSACGRTDVIYSTDSASGTSGGGR